MACILQSAAAAVFRIIFILHARFRRNIFLYGVFLEGVEHIILLGDMHAGKCRNYITF